MGAIQNAANQLAQTGLGAAVATKHLKQQADSLKEQEANKELSLANATIATQSEFNTNNAEAEKIALRRKEHFKGYHENMVEWGKQADYEASGKHPNGLYNAKRKEAAKTAAMSYQLGLQQDQEDFERSQALHDFLVDKKNKLRDIAGKEVVDIQGLETQRWLRARKQYQDALPKESDVNEGSAQIHSRLQGVIDDWDKGGKK